MQNTTTTDRGLERVELDDLSPLLKAAEEQSVPVIVFLHGGGFTLGDAYGNSVSLVADMLAATQKGETPPPVILASVDYSLSPEYVFPTAVLETLNVVSYLLDFPNAAVSKIHLGGESAGANLAAVAAMEGARRYPGRIASSLMMCPCFNPAGNSMSCYTNSQDVFVPWLRWSLQCYIGMPPATNDEEHNNPTTLKQVLAKDSNQTAWNQSKWKGSLWERLVNPTIDIPSNLDDELAFPLLVVTNSGDPLLDDGIAFVEKLKERKAAKVTHYEHRGSHTLGTILDSKGKMEVYQTWAQALFQE